MIEIKITGDTPLEAMATLTACGMYCMADKDVYASAQKILEAERAKDAARELKLDASADTVPTSDGPETGKPPAESGKADPLPNSQTSGDLPPAAEPNKPSQGEPEPAPAAEGRPKPFTLEEVRSASVNTARVKGKPAVRAILQDLGVSSTPDLAPEQYPEFMRRLGELNAQ